MLTLCEIKDPQGNVNPRLLLLLQWIGGQCVLEDIYLHTDRHGMSQADRTHVTGGHRQAEGRHVTIRHHLPRASTRRPIPRRQSATPMASLPFSLRGTYSTAEA